ncbi:hypothetical protein V1509DRAFT_677162 [Lipomyces kononenkoae]
MVVLVVVVGLVVVLRFRVWLSDVVVAYQAVVVLRESNYYFLASLDPSTRDNVIEAAINGDAKVIRTFLRHEAYTLENGDAKNIWPDIENPMGTFANNLSSFMDHYDDLLYLVYKKSGGQTKVILAVHDANFIAGFTKVLLSLQEESAVQTPEKLLLRQAVRTGLQRSFNAMQLALSRCTDTTNSLGHLMLARCGVSYSVGLASLYHKH